MTGIEFRPSLNVRGHDSIRALRLAGEYRGSRDMERPRSRGQRSLFRLAPAILEPQAEHARRTWHILRKPTGVVGKYYRASIP